MLEQDPRARVQRERNIACDHRAFRVLAIAPWHPKLLRRLGAVIHAGRGGPREGSSSWNDKRISCAAARAIASRHRPASVRLSPSSVRQGAPAALSAPKSVSSRPFQTLCHRARLQNLHAQPRAFQSHTGLFQAYRMRAGVFAMQITVA